MSLSFPVVCEASVDGPSFGKQNPKDLGAESEFDVFPIEDRYREPQNRENEKRKEKTGRLRVPSRGFGYLLKSDILRPPRRVTDGTD
jgi:hypothetical protein